MVEGTSCGGREIFRRLIYRAEKLLKSGAHPIQEIVGTIESDFERFGFLQTEFATLLGQYWGGTVEGWKSIPIRRVGRVVVLALARARVEWANSQPAVPTGSTSNSNASNTQSPRNFSTATEWARVHAVLLTERQRWPDEHKHELRARLLRFCEHSL